MFLPTCLVARLPTCRSDFAACLSTSLPACLPVGLPTCLPSGPSPGQRHEWSHAAGSLASGCQRSVRTLQGEEPRGGAGARARPHSAWQGQGQRRWRWRQEERRAARPRGEQRSRYPPHVPRCGGGSAPREERSGLRAAAASERGGREHGEAARHGIDAAGEHGTCTVQVWSLDHR